MTTRLKFIIEQTGISPIEVDYDRAELGLWITQDGDRVFVESAVVEDLRSALFEQHDALENDIWEAEQGAAAASLTAAPDNVNSDRQCGSPHPGQDVVCTKTAGHTTTGPPVDRFHEGSDGPVAYAWGE